jgi:hypothetical protein
VRIFYATSDVPSPGHRAPGAVTIVTFEAAAALVELGHTVVLQPLLPAPPSSEQAADLTALTQAGLRVEEPLLVPQARARRLDLVRTALSGGVGDFFPAVRLTQEVARRVDRAGAELVLHLWSPEALAACSRVDPPVFAYYGNPDHKPFAARLAHPALFDLRRASAEDRLRLHLAGRANGRRLEANVQLMESCRYAGNVCALDADFYAEHGHPNAFYIQNMWSENEPGSPDSDDVIVGSIGNVGATGNTFGLHYLGTEIVPALERMRGSAFTVLVCGGGTPTSAVDRALDRPSIRRLGWVDDIDATIRSAKVFLLANNNHPDFLVGHTRVLHAWSLGACVVAHTGMALAMPEIVHGENALLGASAEEIAGLVSAALEDAGLRERIAAGGLETFRREFVPRVVMERVLARAAS